jgi:multimeric flavodoxin WrbA
MGDGDAWPQIRAQLVGADILIISTPTWMGQQSSVCQRVLERLDAELSETGDNAQPVVSGKVAVAAVVGNEGNASATATAAANAAHLARLLRGNGYPPVK